MNYILVFVGGGLGSICRFAIAVWIKEYNTTFPYATLLANIISCIILGLLVGMTMKGNLEDYQKLMFMTGFCGGFSTFSTFSFETLHLLQSGELSYAIANILASLLVCIICIYLGIKLIS